MEARIVRESDMFGRALVFWKGNPADIPAGSKGATYYANLGSISSQLVAAGATQKSGKVTAQTALVLALDADLKNIAHTASASARNLYKNSPDKLRAWTSASHVEHDPEHAAATPAPVPTPTK